MTSFTSLIVWLIAIASRKARGAGDAFGDGIDLPAKAWIVIFTAMILGGILFYYRSFPRGDV